MGRKKAIRVPFLKLKLKSQTVYGVFSLMFLLLFGLSILSYNQNATLLNSYNVWLKSYFGPVAILFSFTFLFAAGVMVQSKRFKFVKPNWFLGYVLIFFASLVIIRAGLVGGMLNNQLNPLLSRPGTIATFLFIFLVGILIIFEISLPDFVKNISKFLGQIKKQFSDVMAKQKKAKVDTKEDKKESDFIEDPMIQDKQFDKSKATATIPAMVQGDLKPFIKSTAMTIGAGQWKYPSLSLLDRVNPKEAERGDVKQNAHIIEDTLDSFGVRAEVVDFNYGPAVTQYALKITKGVRLNKITSLSNNLALALASPHGLIRIEAPIPGKSLVGIEVPNIKSEIVPLRKMLELSEFKVNGNTLRVPLGYDVSNTPRLIDLNDMPHILIAGTTGSGKSVLLSAWISTLLFRAAPNELRMILIDPKRVTFMPFDGIPHLLTSVITDLKETISALKWAVKQMEERYHLLSENKTRDIFAYNQKITDPEKKMPLIVIAIDELADLMMYASKEVEDTITRIAQKARAVGLYLVIATQRPEVKVITGLMKANIPARISFKVSTLIDSRVILDTPGAEKLVGRGDMLFLSPHESKPYRIQGPYITDKETNNLVDYLKQQQPSVHYTDEVTEQTVKAVVDTSGRMIIKSAEKDPYFEEAIKLICQAKKASASLLQRRLSIGYSRAARILDELEADGIVGPAEGSKPRKVLINNPEEVLTRN